jgi:hypothetical protein
MSIHEELISGNEWNGSDISDLKFEFRASLNYLLQFHRGAGAALLSIFSLFSKKPSSSWIFVTL